jgi:hypothetical protein
MELSVDHNKSIERTLGRIIGQSVETYYNPYKMFQWPESLPDDQWWMSRDLMSVRGTPYEKELSEAQLMTLSKWESIHFYSLNVHGIRELLIEVVKRVHTAGFEIESEFLHHFIGEENEHMWFFATFCLKYGNKIYPDKKAKWQLSEVTDPQIESFLVFSRILIFEEIVDYFNVRIGRDESLHTIIRQVNNIHHQDESRHIAFGRELVKHLWDRLQAQHDRARLQEIGNYLSRYLIASIQSLYSPAAYSDAGIPDPYKVRTFLLTDPVRREYDAKALKRTLDFFIANGIVDAEPAIVSAVGEE